MLGAGGMMKQVQKMQAEMARIQNELADERIEGSAGGGMVKVVANGQQEILDIAIAPEVVDPDDIETLQDLVLAAVRDAMKRSQDAAAEKMSKLTGGLKLPGM
ncbi:MAG: YbaB/EbfC family nucleoid-associated protein [bacterium]|jgi:DNA-binding YbaB/EbfC family protein|nr:YbaB/EbfC family nucleoid-associated protein [bacterium]MDD3804718.1 YbaB/EbfC family nucleoid-associated protein [bacterium]MDD4152184.1 YbaB/EbfC family nucleoid-associated protein [bacterium]MDD4558632.1 YbaB/EbfC family nucleoid-associated protein [bacterium]